jgi:hypothetical protein
MMRRTLGLGMIPADDTLREHISTIVREPLLESGFVDRRLDVALEHFERLGYHSKVFLLVNDATALLPAIGYRALDDSVHGYAVSDDLLAHLDVRAGDSVEAFIERFHSLPLANQVELILLVPLAPNCPPYILAAFAQDGSQSMETVSRRLAIATTEMERRGALVIGWAADGASAHFKLMRQLHALSPGAPVIKIPGVPTLKGELVTEQLCARPATFNGKPLLLPTMPILDPVHHVNLLRNSALRKGFAGRVGDATISMARARDFFEQRLGQFGMEAELGVHYTDFVIEDRMNFAAAQRVFSTPVVAYLAQHGGGELKGMAASLVVAVLLADVRTQGELFFFRLCNAVLRSYLDPTLEPLQHVEEAFMALFMLEGWFTQLKEEDEKRKEADRINKGEEKARVCSERGISKRQYEQEQREERQRRKEAHEADKERQKREADALKEARRKNKRRRKGQAQASASAAAVVAPALVAPAAAAPAPPAASRRPTVAAQFITRTAAAGVSFNAWFLFGFVYTLITNDELRRSIPFAPRQLTEQEAEKIFRAARAVLGGENFTFADFLRRCDHLIAHGILKTQHGGVDFVYPEPDKAWKWDEKLASDRKATPLPDAITLAALLQAVQTAQARAVAALGKVGIDVASVATVRHLTADNHVNEMDNEEDVHHELQLPVQKDVGDVMKQLRADLELAADVVRVFALPLVQFLT